MHTAIQGLTPLLLAGVLLAGTPGKAGRLNTAAYRFTLEKDDTSPWPADVGYAEIYPGILAPTNSTMSVVSHDGKVVPSKILWSAEGEPAKIMFDTSHHQQEYEVYVGMESTSNAASSWEPRAGLILETRERIDRPVDNLAQMKEVWEKGGRIFGRSLVPKIFEGIHCHGLSRNYVGRYSGYFTASNGGEYVFATISDNASFLLIDGKPVAEWPGLHNASGGVRGEHQGKIQLNEGIHAIEYYLVHAAFNAVAAAAWKGPQENRFAIMTNSAFVPVAVFHSTSLTAAPDGKMVAGFEWEMMEHATAGDATMVTAEFRSLPLDTNNICAYQWNFEDGTMQTGSVARHVFLLPGLRSVRLDVVSKDHAPCSLEQNVHIHPRWLQVEECPRNVVERQKAEIMTRNLLALPVQELWAAVMFADADQDRPWLVQLGDVCLKRKTDFGPESANVFYILAGNYEHSGVRDFNRAQEAYRAVFALKPINPLAARAALQWAGLLIHGLIKADEAAERLKSIDTTHLEANDKRLYRIYLADILLAQGRETQAREAYLQIGGIADKADVLQSVKQSIRLENARNYITGREFDAAYRILREVEWETPVRRLSPQTGFPLIETYLGRKEYPQALTRCLLLANARLAGDDQAGLLFLTAETYGAWGQKAEAGNVYRRLISEFPSTEFAARAKEKLKEQQ